MNNNLPTIASLLEHADFDRIKKICEREFKQAVESDEFTLRWHVVIESYKKWESTFIGQHTSDLNRRLELLGLIEKKLPEMDWRGINELTDIILASLTKVGDLIKLPNAQTGVVIRREITSRLGALFTVRLHDGTLVSYEFFD
jgi:hypothetical protein